MAQQRNGDNCPPDQPDKWGCLPLEGLPEVPPLPDAIICPNDCNCPKPPTSTGTCFDSLISEQTELLNKAAAAKQFKDDLEDLLKKASAGRQNYTPKKWNEFLEAWNKQDGDIIALIDKLRCHIDCWECLIKCEICPLLYKIRDTQRELEGTGELISATFSLRDQRHWYERLVYNRGVVFNRIKDVLKAWEDPVKAIEKNLNDNKALIEKIDSTTLCSAPVDAVFQIFVNLIPMHLAIGPREDATVKETVDGQETEVKVKRPKTKIPEKYLNICDCDPGGRDDCCGPDLGALSVIEQLIGPQAYIIDPNEYFDVICCVATSRYIPAKKHFDEATAKLVVINEKIKRSEADIPKKKTDLFNDYRASVIVPVGKRYCPEESPPDECPPRTEETTPRNAS